MYPTLESTWGTNDLTAVFGGGPDDNTDDLCAVAGDYSPSAPRSETGFMPGLISWCEALEAEACREARA